MNSGSELGKDRHRWCLALRRSTGICLLGAALLSTACGPDRKTKLALADNQQLRIRAKAAQAAADRDEASARDVRSAATRLREEWSVKEKGITAELAALEEELNEVTTAFEECRSQYRATARATGRKLGRVQCGKDQIFEDVEILKVTPGEMTFRHANGMARIALDKLDPALRENLDYNPGEAAAWLAANSAAPRFSSQDYAKERAREEKDKMFLAAQNRAKARDERNKRSAFAVRQRFITVLHQTYARVRRIQADTKGCPIEKRQSLAMCKEQVLKLQKIISSIDVK